MKVNAFTAIICVCYTLWEYKKYFDLTFSKLYIGQTKKQVEVFIFRRITSFESNIICKRKLGH